MQLTSADFYDRAALQDRLTFGVRDIGRPVRFLVGSAVSAAPDSATAGVLRVSEIIALIRSDLPEDRLDEFDTELAKGGNPYQAAFSYLLGRKGQQSANEIVKRAVLNSRRPIYSSTDQSAPSLQPRLTDDICAGLEDDVDGWTLAPAVAALGSMVASSPSIFGKHIFTTNFDPLLSVAIKRAGGRLHRTALHRDGDIGQTKADGCHVVHCHGYWYGSDTLHTPRQLTQDRPRLKTSLARVLGDDLLVVSGYGAWNDVITKTLIDVALDDRMSPEIIWTFREDDPQIDENLLAILTPGIERGRVSLYRGIDCHEFFPTVASYWAQTTDESPGINMRAPTTRAVRAPKPAVDAPTLKKPSGQVFFDNHDRDTPPDVQFYVGRDDDVQFVDKARQAVVILTGIGGQGKSALASTYFTGKSAERRYRYRIWRDCREEGDRFERQIASLISAMSRGQVSANELGSQPITNLVDLFVSLIGEDKFLFVFDNVDHYVDLENGSIGGPPAYLIDRLDAVSNGSKFIFTCRPTIIDDRKHVLSRRLAGLTLPAAVELFRQRGAATDLEDISKVHASTNGHALWLDLLAAQASKRPEISLSDLVGSLTGQGSDLPQQTLQVIWELLLNDERLVLRALAETVRSSTEIELKDFLFGQVRYNRVQKAVSSLRDQSLVVTKGGHFHRVVELHPLVRSFIRQRFSKSERMSYIDAIINFYLPFLKGVVPEVSAKLSMEKLQYFIDVAQLRIEAGDYDGAFLVLSQVGAAMRASSAPGEFVRVARRLFSEIDWDNFESFSGSESVFASNFEIMARLGRVDECEELLELYLNTVEGKSARYIHYCDMNCYLNWVNGNYGVAIRWGEEGAALKASSDVDTKFDTASNLALARRDAGYVDAALQYFRFGMKIEDIIDPAQIDEQRAGAFYGNVGRCLHLLGQVDSALSCYKKSAKLIEAKPDGEHVCNQAYARQWVGELMITKGRDRDGESFLRAALAKWECVSPPRANLLSKSIDGLDGMSADLSFDDCETAFLKWISSPEL